MRVWVDGNGPGTSLLCLSGCADDTHIIQRVNEAVVGRGTGTAGTLRGRMGKMDGGHSSQVNPISVLISSDSRCLHDRANPWRKWS